MQDIVPQSETTHIGNASAKSGRRDGTVQSITRALRVLEGLSRQQPIGISELSRSLGLHKSTIHRILGTLEREGYVRQDSGTERFSLGLKVLGLAEGLKAHMDVRVHAVEHMRQLVDETHETVHLGVFANDEVMCIDSVVSDRRNAIGSMAGKHTHAHVSSMGKAILALSPEPAVLGVVERRGLMRLTPKTITDRDAFLRNLELVRQNRYAVSDEEEEIGIRCIAAPICDHRGEPIAALSVAAPAARLEGQVLVSVAERLVAHAKRITMSLGGP